MLENKILFEKKLEEILINCCKNIKTKILKDELLGVIRRIYDAKTTICYKDYFLFEELEKFRFYIPEQKTSLNYLIDIDNLKTKGLYGFKLTLEQFIDIFLYTINSTYKHSRQKFNISERFITSIFQKAKEEGLITILNKGIHTEKKIINKEKLFNFLYHYIFWKNKLTLKQKYDILFYAQIKGWKDTVSEFDINKDVYTRIILDSYKKDIIITNLSKRRRKYIILKNHPDEEIQNFILNYPFKMGKDKRVSQKYRGVGNYLDYRNLLKMLERKGYIRFVDDEIKLYQKLCYDLGEICRDYFFYLYFRRTLENEEDTKIKNLDYFHF